MIPLWLEWLAQIAEVAAGVSLAIPALRLSKHMLQRHEIQETQDLRQPELERLRYKYMSAMSRLLANWDPLDHLLVRIGFAAFIFSATVGLLGILPAQ